MRHRWQWVVPLVASCALIGCQTGESTKSEWKTVSIGKGRVTLRIPADYLQEFEPEDTLLLIPPSDPGVILRFNVITPADPQNSGNAGLRFVQIQAEEKHVKATQVGENVVFTESSSNVERGVKSETRFYQIGIQNHVVIMAATIVDGKKDSTPVKTCLDNVVPQLIQSLRE